MTLRSAAALLALLFACPLPSSGQTAGPHLIINDIDVTLQTTPLVQDGVLLLPADLVARAFGAAPGWDAAARTLTLAGASGIHVRLSAGQTRADVDGAPRDLPAAPVLRDGVLWAPAVALLRALGAYVVDGDDGHTQTALAQVTNVAWRADGGALAVLVSATGPVRVDPHVLHGPERLVLDLAGAVARLPDTSQDIGIAGILRVRGGQYQVRPFITRIVFDLDHAMKYTVASRPGEVALVLGDVAASSAAQVSPAPAAPAPQATPTPPPATAASAPPSSVPAPPTSTSSAGPPADSRPPAPSSAGPLTDSRPPASSSAGPLTDSRPPARGASAGPASPSTAAPSAAAPPVTPSTPSAPVPPAAATPPAPGAASPNPGPAATPAAPSDASGAAPEPLAPPPLPDFADRPGAFHVQAVAYDDQDRTGRITIRASQRVTYTLQQFVYPDRLAIDIVGGVYLARRHDIEVGSDTVRNIVVSQFQLRPNLTRVLVHLYHKMPYSAAVADGGRTLVVTLGDPGRRVARRSAVIIDPGHGGVDSGAVGPTGLRESDVALAIARLVHDDLTAQGIPSVMTRTDDSTVSLEERPDLAQRNGGIVFVSIHANASSSIGPAGTETYYETPQSQALARLMQAEVTQALGEPDRGIHTANFYVLVNTPMPAVLVETAFITNPSEEAMLRDPAVRRRIADAIARAIAQYLVADRQAPAP